MKYLCLLFLLAGCVEYRLSRPNMPDKYIGWAQTNYSLDPKVGPKVKAFLTPGGRIRPYIGGEIIRKEELLIGLGVIYYASEGISFEIGYRDSVYKDTTLLEEEHKDSTRIDPWEEMNPMFYGGMVWRF